MRFNIIEKKIIIIIKIIVTTVNVLLSLLLHFCTDFPLQTLLVFVGEGTKMFLAPGAGHPTPLIMRALRSKLFVVTFIIN